MSQIVVQDLTFHYETQEENIFEHASFVLDTDWKLGFIGRNGRGKTTFLRLLMGEHPYQGRIEAHVSFDYFPFDVPDEGLAARRALRGLIAPFDAWEAEMEACLVRSGDDALARYGAVLEQYEAAGGFTIDAAIEAEAGRLGVPPGALDRPWRLLSGGEQVKLKLAALFLRQGNFLLIDEPTNHLDWEGRRQVADYLSRKHGFILVSHDRQFLDRVVDHVLSINRCTIEVQQGNYTTWLANRTRLEAFERTEQEKRKREVARLEQARRQTADWSRKAEQTKTGGARNSGLRPDRGFIGHRSAKMMKRAKSLEARQDAALTEKSALLRDVETAQRLTFHPLAAPKQVLIEAAGLTVIRNGRALFEPVSFTLRQGERLAVRGPNGCGKTTLLRLLGGEDLPYEGRLLRAGGLQISVVPQSTAGLRGSLRAYARDCGVDETLFLAILRKLDFSRVQFDKDLEAYSEGQKKKVLLAASLSQRAQLYLWDEPLNFVDVLSREQLENAIQTGAPSMVFVEHDALFCERAATRQLSLVSPK